MTIICDVLLSVCGDLSAVVLCVEIKFLPSSMFIMCYYDEVTQLFLYILPVEL